MYPREKEEKRAKNCFFLFLFLFFLLFTRNIFTAFFTGNPVAHGLEAKKRKKKGGGSKRSLKMLNELTFEGG